MKFCQVSVDPGAYNVLIYIRETAAGGNWAVDRI